ncbi:hypothetical protein H9P43_009374 [Blastocladiella emersonii ATCC 22665]|nr:hypothetical protein H9P43_009374 [Blastocladiella emersonii ATCC 22665]
MTTLPNLSKEASDGASTSSSGRSSTRSSPARTRLSLPRRRAGFIETLVTIHHQVILGLHDSVVNFRSALGVVAGSGTIRSLAVKCFLVNGVLLLGSTLFYRVVIKTFIASLFGLMLDDRSRPQGGNVAFHITNKLVYALYYILWMYPIHSLSLYLNSRWYRRIAKQALEIHADRLEKAGDPAKAAAHAAAHVPPVLPPKDPKQKWLPRLLLDKLHRVMLKTVFIALAYATYFMPTVGPVLAFVLMSWKNSMLSFEPKWRRQGWPLEARLRHMDERWPYYLGFGFPVAVLAFLNINNPTTNALVFALLLPVYIVAAAISAPPPLGVRPKWLAVGSGSKKGEAHAYAHAAVPRLPIFSVIGFATRQFLHR